MPDPDTLLRSSFSTVGRKELLGFSFNAFRSHPSKHGIKILQFDDKGDENRNSRHLQLKSISCATLSTCPQVTQEAATIFSPHGAALPYQVIYHGLGTCSPHKAGIVYIPFL